MLNTNSKILPIVIINIVYLSIASVFALGRSNYEFIFYIGVVLIIAGGLAWIYVKDGLSTPILWAMTVWGFLHMSGGLVHIPESWPRPKDPSVLYNLWLIPGYFKFDQFVHGYGFGITTWLIWEVVRGSIIRRNPNLKSVRPTFGLIFLCVCASMGLGSLNELLEFMAVLLLPKTNVGGYYNTCWDMAFNTLGSVLVGTFIYIRENQRHLLSQDLERS